MGLVLSHEKKKGNKHRQRKADTMYRIALQYIMGKKAKIDIRTHS